MPRKWSFNEKEYRWETDFIPNADFEKIDPQEGETKAFGRFKSIYEQGQKAGAWDKILTKFEKELKLRNIIPFEEFAEQYPDVVANEVSGHMVLSWAWKSVPLGTEDSSVGRVGGSGGVRLVGNQSLKHTGGISLNSSLEYGNSNLASVFKTIVNFHCAPQAAIGDLQSAYFSVLQSPKLQNRSRFYFS